LSKVDYKLTRSEDKLAVGFKAESRRAVGFYNWEEERFG